MEEKMVTRAWCPVCKKYVSATIQYIPDYEEYQGRMVKTGYTEKIICDDCGAEIVLGPVPMLTNEEVEELALELPC
jgi:hypothetical protein